MVREGGSMLLDKEMSCEYRDFNPTHEVIDLISRLADKIVSSAPSDSIVRIVFEHGKGAIQGSCRIVSKAGIFFAESVGESPLRAMEQIDTSIRDQLEVWKKTRFSSRLSESASFSS